MLLRRNRLAAFLAVLAMALQAFWPLVSLARAKDPALFSTICSVDGGTRTIDLSGTQHPADGGAGKHQKHCPLCVGSGDRVQTPVSLPVSLFHFPALAAEVPAALPAAEIRTTAVTPAQPRAPPVQI